MNLSNSAVAANDIGGTEVFTYFIWGMPYFFGRTTYFGMGLINANTLTYTQNPYYAF